MGDVYCLKGRRVIKTSETEVTDSNVLQILTQALAIHNQNRAEIQYLWDYYRGDQPVLQRTKEVRPEICNKIVVNRAMEIVNFHTGYLLGEPIQYISRESASQENVNKLNEYVFTDEKASLDKELADWMHICGTSYRIALPAQDEDDDERPFDIYNLDPRDSFVVYSTELGNRPMLGVYGVRDISDGTNKYYCYSNREFWEIKDCSEIVKHTYHIMGDIPIVEYPLNHARIGAFETVITILDAISLAESNRLDSVEQVVQALLLFHNVDISSEDYKKLREEGAIKFRDIDAQMRADIQYITTNISQGETQILIDSMYQTVLTICCMPNRNGGSSTSDTGQAVELRDGWSSAENYAKNSELMFKKSDKRLLRLILKICEARPDAPKMKASDIEIRFTRRNYENIATKSQVLIGMLGCDKIHPKLAFQSCGMFPDSELAYTISDEYAKEQEKKLNETRNFTTAGGANGEDSATRKPSGSPGGTQGSSDRGDQEEAD